MLVSDKQHAAINFIFHHRCLLKAITAPKSLQGDYFSLKCANLRFCVCLLFWATFHLCVSLSFLTVWKSNTGCPFPSLRVCCCLSSYHLLACLCLSVCLCSGLCVGMHACICAHSLHGLSDVTRVWLWNSAMFAVIPSNSSNIVVKQNRTREDFWELNVNFLPSSAATDRHLI